MDAKLLQRVMDLAEKTGDRVIIVNPKSGTAHAVVPFDSYEKMAQGTASLRHLEDDFGDDFAFDGPEEDDDEEEEIASPEPEFDIEPLAEKKSEELVKKAVEQAIVNKIAEESEKEAELPVGMDILEDEESEEQYYLEPLE